jgi:uncharacterized protein (DUF849 family)
VSEGPTPLIIEARVNELAVKEESSHVPYTVRELITEAGAVQRAGATVFHWHARDSTGRPRNDVASYLKVGRAIRATTDLVIHPTLGFTAQASNRRRLRHVIRMAQDPEPCVDMAGVDTGSIVTDEWDVDRRVFLTDERVYRNPTAQLIDQLKVASEYPIPVNPACWNAGHVRTAVALQQLGLFRARAMWYLVFSGDRLPHGAVPTIKGLRAMLEFVPHGQPWIVMCYRGDVFPLASWAIALGGHVAVGLGDFPYAPARSTTNADLVERVAVVARAAGRPLATPQEARVVLGLPTRTGVARVTDAGRGSEAGSVLHGSIP